MFLVYSLLFSFGALLMAPYYLWQHRGRGRSSAYWRERLGHLPRDFQQPAGSKVGGSIWVHAVSVGETLAVAGLVRELQKQYPQRRIFLSHITPAGRETSEARLPNVAGRFYLPLDWKVCVRRTVRRLQPALLIITETELWPNLLRAAHEFGCRVVIVNARLSESSFGGYRLVRSFMRRLLQNVDCIFAQTEIDAERFREIGAPPERVLAAGNLKFDGTPPQAGELAGRLRSVLEEAQRGPVLVAASTMPREEPLVLRAWQEIRNRYPQALLILAPRHPVRFEQVAQLLSDQKRRFVRRTALETGREELVSQLASPEILLLNTIGELAGLFQAADVVFIGGSLVPTGGHNLLEPAFWSKPVIFGPHMHNFRDSAARFLRAGAAVQVESPAQLAAECIRLLGNGGRREELGARGRRVLEEESGATQRILERLRLAEF
jgi:3-deoxy-D-manno-octulosonic-acid transferase